MNDCSSEQLNWFAEVFTAAETDVVKTLLAGSSPAPCCLYFALLQLLHALHEGSICLTRKDFIAAQGSLLSCDEWFEKTGHNIELDGTVLVGADSAQSGELVPVVREGDCWFYNRAYRKLMSVRSALGKLLELKSVDQTNLPTLVHTVISDYPVVLNSEQRRAVYLALYSRLVLITGGPGTGKTTVAGALLRALFASGVSSTQVALVAPTGRAAMRLEEALQSAIPEINIEVMTLHRLLDASRFGHFRRNRRNPLWFKVVLVDEMSMVDISLLGALLEALPEGARLILMGDMQQLPPVEAGAVLARLVPESVPVFSKEFLQFMGDSEKEEGEEEPWRDRWVHLNQTQRFGGTLAEFASGILQGKYREDSIESFDLLKSKGDFSEGVFYDGGGIADEKVLPAFLQKLLRHGDSPQLVKTLYFIWLQYGESGKKTFKGQNEAEEFFSVFEKSRVLVPFRQGPEGSERINQLSMQMLWGMSVQQNCTHGLPLIFLENRPSLRISNGDTGICLGKEEKLVWLRERNGFRQLSPVRLPRFSPAFAHTVHRAQGSEYGHILIPASQQALQSGLLRRELLYTAITRARKTAILLGEEELFRAAIRERTLADQPYRVWP